jgi:methylglutaconyl-CoA hydratase
MISQIASGHIKIEKHSGITSIEFFHPQSNSLPAVLLDELAKELHSAAHDEETKVIVLRSGGEKAFCAGASFEELLAIKDKEQGTKFFSGFAKVINAMRKCPQFIVTRVQGKAVGGGVGLVAASDYAIALEGADIKLSELEIGIGPFVVGPVIERKIGVSSFSQLAIDAALWRSADWARKKGLYAELHSSQDAMDESIRRLVTHLAHSNPAAVKEMKNIFWKGTEDWDKLLVERAAISGKLILSEFSKNALQKIKGKK